MELPGLEFSERDGKPKEWSCNARQHVSSRTESSAAGPEELDFIQVKFLLPLYNPFLEWDVFYTAVLEIPCKHAGIRELGLTKMLLEGHRAPGSWFGGLGRIYLASAEWRVVSCPERPAFGS